MAMLFTFNHTTRPSLTSFALPTGYLLATSLCSLLRHMSLRLFHHLVVGSHPIPSSTIASLCLRCQPLRNEGTIAMTIIFKNALVPHAIKLLQKCVISNKVRNIHSRGPTEQHFYVWEPHRGCLNKVKKVRWYPLIKEGQQSHKCAL